MTAERAFDQYHEAVFRFVYRMTRQAEAAEDITQDCFLVLVRAPERFDAQRGSLKTYLFSIARNLVLKAYRDNREVPLDGEEYESTPDPAMAADLASAVEQAVASLPPLQREALVLFEYEGFTLEEVAQVSGVDVGTIKSRLHRARERLKKVLAPHRKVGNLYGTV